jgi:nucleoside-diphosphate-sugar epimerase
MILVTGGNGFIGSNLVKYFRDSGYQVIVADRVRKNPDAKNEYIGDLLDPEFLKTFENTYEAIFHCAGSASVRDSIINPFIDFDSNVRATVNMLEFAKSTNSNTFIFLSTVSVFDSTNSLPLTEYSIKKPTSPYGAAKLASEGYCQAYHRTFGIDTRIARIFNTFGPDCNHLFVYDMIEKIKNASTEIVFGGNGKQLRDYVYISDLICAINLIWENGTPGEDYNICSGQPVKLLDIVSKLIQLLDKPNLTIKIEDKPQKGDIEKWYGNPEKIKSLGFKPRIDLQNGLEKVLESLRNQNSNVS